MLLASRAVETFSSCVFMGADQKSLAPQYLVSKSLPDAYGMDHFQSLNVKKFDLYTFDKHLEDKLNDSL